MSVWSVGADPAGYGSPIAIDVGKNGCSSVPPASRSSASIRSRATFYGAIPSATSPTPTCATPVWTSDRLFVSAAYGTGCAALEITARRRQVGRA